MNHEKPIIKNKEWIGRIPSDLISLRSKNTLLLRIQKCSIYLSPLKSFMGDVVDQMENVSKSDNSGKRKTC